LAHSKLHFNCTLGLAAKKLLDFCVRIPYRALLHVRVRVRVHVRIRRRLHAHSPRALKIDIAPWMTQQANKRSDVQRASLGIC